MESAQKLAFIVQANRLQGLIWQALFKSQSFAAILEPSRSDLVDCISQIAEAGLTLPDIIILDTEISDINPYEFCRWCRQQFPRIQVFLTRTYRGPIAETERRWAMQQGAAGFLYGFHRETLMSSAADSMRLILAALDVPFLDEKSLLSVLLNIRRQLNQTPASTALTTAKTAESYSSNGSAQDKRYAANGSTAASSSQPDLLNDISWVSSGLRALNQHNGQNGQGTQGKPAPIFTADLDNPPPPAEPPSTERDEAVSKPTKQRRYRGVVY
ncbi:MAG: response regulator [Spirulina sp.]